MITILFSIHHLGGGRAWRIIWHPWRLDDLTYLYRDKFILPPLIAWDPNPLTIPTLLIILFRDKSLPGPPGIPPQ